MGIFPQLFIKRCIEMIAVIDGEERIVQDELSDESYLRICRENRERRIAAERRREGFRRAKALIENGKN
jgi:hypothetical protein